MAGVIDSLDTVVAVLLTLFVFSFLLGDNALYRLAEHLFVGVAIGYAVVIAFHSVLVPRLITPLAEGLETQNWGQVLLALIALLFGLLLLLKPLRSLSWWGNLSIALLLGIGAALAIGGALLGTLIPQVAATADMPRYSALYGPGLGLFSGIVVVVGTIGVVLHFHFGRGREGRFSALRDAVVHSWGGLGRWFVLIAFAAILATTFLSRLSLLVGRVQFVLDSVQGLLGGQG
ncbi:MAG: hypothetical protein PHY79_15775 [Anaerolineae bacterium]|jgi:hypothetical protein|nr:hypothetical protein [Anaerolineae bacterium]MDX9830041.1 hypothetical protein [Anaerolineae bacterium]